MFIPSLAAIPTSCFLDTPLYLPSPIHRNRAYDNTRTFFLGQGQGLNSQTKDKEFTSRPGTQLSIKVQSLTTKADDLDHHKQIGNMTQNYTRQTRYMHNVSIRHVSSLPTYPYTVIFEFVHPFNHRTMPGKLCD